MPNQSFEKQVMLVLKDGQIDVVRKPEGIELIILDYDVQDETPALEHYLEEDNASRDLTATEYRHLKEYNLS